MIWAKMANRLLIKKYCSTTANRGRKLYQSIDNFKLPGQQFSFIYFKGTPSRKEHKTVLIVITTNGSASTGRIGLL